MISLFATILHYHILRNVRPSKIHTRLTFLVQVPLGSAMFNLSFLHS